MKLNIHVIGCLILIATAFLITTLAATSVAKPIGADTYYHLTVATYYSHGQIIEGLNYSLTHDLFFYPPIFHFLITPLIWSNNPYFYARILEALLLPLTFAFTIYLMAKKASAKAAFITGLCLLGSLAFVDGAIQLRPESLDLLLYPMMLLAILNVKKKSFITMAVITAYSHSIAALSSIYGLTIKLYKDHKEWRRTILAGTAIVAPLLAISIYYVSGAFKMWFTLAGANTSNPQQTLFWTHPLTFIPIYSGLTLIGFAFLLKRHKSHFESLLSYGIVFSALMLPFWVDRWLQYITIPLSCLIGLGLQNVKGWKQIPIYLLLVTIAVGYIAYWVLIGLVHGWWQPGD